MTDDWVGVGGPNIAPPATVRSPTASPTPPAVRCMCCCPTAKPSTFPAATWLSGAKRSRAIGGFDARFRAAGDDVDVCWRLQERGGRIGFHAGAMDWHHRRNSLTMYWRQQKATAKPRRCSRKNGRSAIIAAGHLAWAGRLYGRGFTVPIPHGMARIYGGVWGSAAYQSLYQPAPFTLLTLPLMPEWYLVIAALAALSLLGLSWPPLASAFPLFLLAAAAPVVQAAMGAARATFPAPAKSTRDGVQRRLLTAYLHLVQPLARLIGRMRHGLTPWRRRCGAAIAPLSLERETWRETWRSPEQWMLDLESRLRDAGACFRRGGDFDRWDLEARCGAFGAARALLGVEEHGAGKQMGRWRLWSHPSPPAFLVAALLVLLAVGAGLDRAWVATCALSAAGGVLAWRMAADCGSALATLERAVRASEWP